MSIETCGKKIDEIKVKISYKIIQLFSAGLYSSPNKAFEELVCNSYDAFADTVSVYVHPDLTDENACIWVCDNGESMDQEGLKDLWLIGKSFKREDSERDNKRLQIGKFGIGKLATYVLANKFTYICKKDGRYLATTMHYDDITEAKEDEELALDEREISEEETIEEISKYLMGLDDEIVKFKLFGKKSTKTWTFSILTHLKPKAMEITEGRLKWVLSTALPLNPGFNLYYNGNKIESSKIEKPIKMSWVLGKDDSIAENIEGVECINEDKNYFIDFPNLKRLYGQIDLYEDSLVDSSKSTFLGRSHGIFLLVRNRLVNLNDPLLGMSQFTHGPFNKVRMIIHADELDNNLASTRESIKESIPFKQLKDYIQKKFNNEVKKYYFEEENKKDQRASIEYRMSQTSLTISKRPLYVFAQKYFNKEILNPLLIEKPKDEIKDALLKELKRELTSEESIIKEVNWEILESGSPIAKLDLESGTLKINLLHPFIANYNDSYRSYLPLQFIAITEVLTEAYLYEIGIDESTVNDIMRRRDITIRELSLSDRDSAPVAAKLLIDSVSNPSGLEDSVYRAFKSLGFEANKIGGNGKPDGKIDAILGYSEPGVEENYSFTYDAKSTGKEKIKASTANLSVVNSHKTKYKADYAVVIAIDYEGSDNPESSISNQSREQKVTVMKVNDLIRLLLLSAPKQIGLKKIKELLENCYTPIEVKTWLDEIEEEEIKPGPIKELLETIYEFQNKDTEPPELASIRTNLNKKLPSPISKLDVKDLIYSMKILAPGHISLVGEKAGIEGTPKKILDVIGSKINDVPIGLQEMYLKAFSEKK